MPELEQVVDSREEKTDVDVFLDEARLRRDAAYEFERVSRDMGAESLKMLNADQWPEDIYKERQGKRPMLTVNFLPAYVKRIVGEARVNRREIKVLAQTLDNPNAKVPAGRLAEIRGGLIRNIELQSDSGSSAIWALECAASNGFGYFRVTSQQADDELYQDLRIKRIVNPFTVYLDPKHEALDSRDKKWAFIVRTLSRDEFKVLFPGKEPSSWKDANDQFWSSTDEVSVAEYYVMRPFAKTLVKLSDGRTLEKSDWESIKDELKEAEQLVHLNANTGMIEEGPAPPGSNWPEETMNPMPTIVDMREVESHVIAKYIIDGYQILDGPRAGKDEKGEFILNFESNKDIKTPDGKTRDKIWPGKWIPIVPVWGEMTILDNGQIIRRGVIYNAIDPQRMYNYSRTKQIEDTALAPRPKPWMTSRQAAGHETELRNQTLLPYQLYELDGAAPPPFILGDKSASTANSEQVLLAENELKGTTQIYNPMLSAPSNETSGRAITARVQQGEITNIVYGDNLDVAMKFLGDILNDVIASFYDTERQVMILNKQDKEELVTINQAIIDDETGREILMNNMAEGKYLVTVSAGPSFTTQRIEMVTALSEMGKSQEDPLVRAILLKNVLRNSDWPGAQQTADEIEEIINNMKAQGQQGAGGQEAMAGMGGMR